MRHPPKHADIVSCTCGDWLLPSTEQSTTYVPSHDARTQAYYFKGRERARSHVHASHFSTCARPDPTRVRPHAQHGLSRR